MKKVDPFYKSARWKRLRSFILKRDGCMCQISIRYGKRVEATTVHHVFPRDEFPEYQWSAWNLIALSSTRHDELHDRNTGALTDKGIQLLRRVAQRYDMTIPAQYR